MLGGYNHRSFSDELHTGNTTRTCLWKEQTAAEEIMGVAANLRRRWYEMPPTSGSAASKSTSRSGNFGSSRSAA
jgi:hypothetical protein